MATKQATLLSDKLAALADLIGHAQNDLEADPGQCLRDLHLAAETLASATRTAVGIARSDGASWAVVGDALGMSRQAAHERFA